MGALHGLVACLRIAMVGLVVIAFSVMIVSVWLQVGGRYLFGYSVAGMDEIATFSQIWMVFIGAGIAMRFGMHPAIDSLPAMLPLSAARFLKIVNLVGSIVFLGVVVYGSEKLLAIGRFETSPALQIQMWVIYLCIPIGALYLGLEVLVDFISTWKHPFHNPTLKIEEA